VIFATDEVQVCVQCGTEAYEQHGTSRVEDRRWHCRSYLSKLRDLPGSLACEAHRAVCHVDGVTFSLGGTSVCPVCEG
jgi:transposase-like protein